ncbi:MAG: ABC transporter substrate-binding protein [Rubrobacteraceae bacterium]
MYRKSNVLVATLFLLALLLAGCGQSSEGGSTTDVGNGGSGGGTTVAATFPVTIKDSLGRSVEIEAEPERIGSMVPSVTETIFAVGAGNRVVGVSTADDYPPEVESIEKIGDYQQVNAEKIASLETDLLFLSFDSTTKEQARDLENKTGAKVLVINPTTVEAAIQSVGTVGNAVGNPEKARVVEERLQSGLNQLQTEIEGLPQPTVFYEIGYDPLFTVGPGSFINDAIEIAGGNNVASDAQQAYPQYSVEKLLEDDPEYYLAGKSSGVTVEDIKNRQPYSSLQAVQQDRVFVINDNLVNRPGPRIVQGVRLIAETIHPDTFGGGETTSGG